jgi:hypothetical protein
MDKIEIDTFEENQKLIEMRPVNIKRTEKAHSEKLVKRHYYDKSGKVETFLSFYKEILAHRIDNSPRLRSFTI